MTIRLEELHQEQEAIKLFLKHHADNAERSENLLLNQKDYSKLLSPYFIPMSQELNEWAKQPYISNPAYPKQCIHKTTAGIYVRSKSESLITMFLHMNKIPFRYEDSLTLDDVTIYPDFTIRHPQTGEYFYWEHFGMMDNPGYCKSAYSKLQLYTANGILPSVELITTYETMENPLDAELVENIIRFYFL